MIVWDEREGELHIHFHELKKMRKVFAAWLELHPPTET
jgi:hypothetical protein